MRTFARLGWALLIAAAFASAAPAAPALRIVAVGDLHGDFIAWRAIAQAAGIIDGHGSWAGGSTVLVQTGDVVDRGPDSLRIIQDLMRLQREARHAGGTVIALVGNHEAMNMTGDLRYVSAADYAAYADSGSAALRDRVYAANQSAIIAAYRKQDPDLSDAAIRAAWTAANPLGALEHQRAWAPDGPIGRWVMKNPAVVMLDGTLFVHGGISAAFDCLSVADINDRVAAALAKGDTATAAIINNPLGPLWYRGLVTRDAEEQADAAQGTPACPTAKPITDLSMDAETDAVLAAYHAGRIVVAHTPLLSGIAIADNGRLIRIDTGISAVYGGKLGWLEIIDGAAIPHDVPRPFNDPVGSH